MPAPRLCLFLLGLFSSQLLAVPARAADLESVACHVSYGGETRILQARPVVSPYGVAVEKVGSYFLFRVVFQKEPADLAAIKVYVLAAKDSGPTPIHQATHAYPPLLVEAAPWGFTGLNHVYEPLRDGELSYWCEWSGELRDSRSAGQQQ
ncbi:MAG: hypothetical protein ABTR92_21655 [Candidatus Accumulibacter phosphatis]|jgi:hypothetical protein|uniref:hypothetical protein n=1 Tax=Candidatus Accumulibacter sp. ACC012 TaxID=2823332 RepID=UPI0025C28322|nr:hypothetical protein [Candidatus Accumulibacter sp. ACC012]